MRELLRLARYFMTPDDHQADPAGFVATQAAHFGAVGAPACWAALALGACPWLALLVVAIGYAAIELAQVWFGGQSLWDAVTDTSFVMMGAVFLLGAAGGSPIVAASALLLGVAALLAGAIDRTGPSSGS